MTWRREKAKRNVSALQIFDFDLKDLVWDDYWLNYCRGAKEFLLREDLTRTAKCHARYLR